MAGVNSVGWDESVSLGLFMDWALRKEYGIMMLIFSYNFIRK